MKQIILKIGILLFCYTLIISNHIEKSRYFIIGKSNYINLVNRERTWSDEEKKYIPIGEYISKEKYMSFLSTYESHVKNHIISNSSEKISLFENRKNLLITMFLLLSVSLIIISIDLRNNINSTTIGLLLIIPLLILLIENSTKTFPMSFLANRPDIELLEMNIDKLESDLSFLDNRVSDLEY